MAFTVEAMRQKAGGIDPPAVPDLVGNFKGLGIDAVHVAEFHGDGHPDDPGPLRLAELAAMFEECRRLSTTSPSRGGMGSAAISSRPSS